MKAALRSLGFGPLVLKLWHTPIGRIRTSLRHGGPWEQRRTELARREMEAAAAHLPALPPSSAGQPAVTLHFLTGKKYWYQTLFCLWSFARCSGRSLTPVIQDDGSLTDEHRETIRRHFPATTFQSLASAREQLDRLLPANRFPHLQERWMNYPHIRKLIDFHLRSPGWKLVCDSDLLFFRQPDYLLDWLDQPDRPLHATDCQTSYGYSAALLQEVAGRPVPPLVNVGLAGFNSAEIDWARLEHWCATLIAREKTSYYLEQALFALLVTGRTCAVAPAADYITLPTADEVRTGQAVMHHYVDTSQRWYFQKAWRQIVLRP